MEFSFYNFSKGKLKLKANVLLVFLFITWKQINWEGIFNTLSQVFKLSSPRSGYQLYLNTFFVVVVVTYKGYLDEMPKFSVLTGRWDE